MTTVQMLNSPESCVEEMLRGLCAAFPGLGVDLDKRVVTVRGGTSGNVALVSGGGSGHEPFAAGYVGRGMLSAAASGAVFASPPSEHIQAAIRSVATAAGVLVLVPNYTGDCLNFGVAIEKTRSAGIQVEGVVVGEDCALDTLDTHAGRRGMCGLLFEYKICGSLAERGCPLRYLAEAAREVVAAMATIGVGLKACRLPGQRELLFHVAEGEMELGLGVHGEAGLTAVRASSAAETVKTLLSQLTARLALTRDDHVAVLVNNLGSLSQLEQWVVAAEVDRQLTAHGVCVLRMYVGHLMTSLDTIGFQVSVLKLSEAKRSDWLSCLDSKTDAPAWPGSSYSVSLLPRQQLCHVDMDRSEAREISASEEEVTLDRTQRCLLKASQAVVAAEEQLNLLDSGCGDGDCGSTLRRLAEKVASNIASFAGLSRSSLLQKLADMGEREMGGTSGAVYSLMLTTAAARAEDGSDWAQTWRAGLQGIMRYSRARRGDRTMLDALIPACDAFQSAPHSSFAECLSALSCAVAAARDGCEATRCLRARVGRASYVHESRLKDVDAGAFGVCVWLEAILSALQQSVPK